jgi:hypothetical protein
MKKTMKGKSRGFTLFQRAGGWCEPVKKAFENHPGVALLKLQ